MFNYKLLFLRRKFSGSTTSFLDEISAEEISYRAKIVSDHFNEVFEIGRKSDHLQKQLQKEISFNSYSFSEDFEIESGKKYDLVICSLLLHHNANLVKYLQKVRSVLNPGGALIFSIFGNDTLLNLKHDLAKKESENIGKAYQRIIPMIIDKDVVSILSHAGFNEIIVDNYSQEVSYSNFKKLRCDLKETCQGNVMQSVKQALDRNSYLDLHTKNNGRFETKFEIIFATATKSGGGR